VSTDVAIVLTWLDAIASASTGPKLVSALDQAGLQSLRAMPMSEVRTRVSERGQWLPHDWSYSGRGRDDLARWLTTGAGATTSRYYDSHPSLEIARDLLLDLAHDELVRPVYDHADEAIVAMAGAPPDDLAELERWCAQTGTSLFLDGPAALVMTAGPDPSSTKWLAARGGKVSVREALQAAVWAGKKIWRRGSPKVPRAVPPMLREGLAARAAQRWLAEQAPDNDPPGEAPDPKKLPRLAALAEELDQVLQVAEAALGPPSRLKPYPGRMNIILDPPSVQWIESGSHDLSASHQVEFALGPLGLEGISSTLPLWSSLAASPERRAAARLFRRWLGMPAEEIHQRLDRDMALDAMDRFLGDVLPGDSLEIGFELRASANGAWLALLEVVPGRGGRPKLKTLPVANADLSRVDDPEMHHAVATLLGEQAEDDEIRPGEWKEIQGDWARMGATLFAARHLPHLYIKESKRQPLTVRVLPLSLALRAESGVAVELRIDGRPATRDELALIASHSALSAPALDIDWEHHEARLIRVSGAQRSLARALFARGGSFGEDATSRLLDQLPTLTKTLPVHLDDRLAGRRVAGDERLVARLEVVADGLRVSLFCEPLDDGNLLSPGLGQECAYGVIDGERVHVLRDLSAERDRARGLAGDLELSEPDDPDLPWRWTVQDPGLAGQLLGALRDRDDVRVGWSGRTGRVRRGVLGLDKLALQIKPLGEWFAVQGEAKLGKAELPLSALLLAAERGRRFVALGPGDWAELDSALVGRLQPIAAAMRASDDGASVGALHGALFDGLDEQVASFDAPPGWLGARDRIREAAALDGAAPPELNAELRPYQRDGVAWLARLAHWAPGAVLADDMGLGKTVQALALLLRRRGDGPALVVAPASVGFNWGREAARFAPSLRVVDYGGRDRQALLQGLGPNDLLVMSWSLLARDVGALEQVRFSAVVFDEAQAMKNRSTARNKAARRIDTGFKLALTGTPLENHVGELHAILGTVAPGLLGSARRFAERFAGPIATGDAETTRALSQLIAPFVLRRLKRDVATDLPARTEIQLSVDLSDGERAVYERVREAAAAELALAREMKDNQRRFRALGLLTTLRQAACNPRLVEPDSTVPSSKLDTLMERLDELAQEGHRALVFSQFTSHLRLVRDALQDAGVRTMYLDGGTPKAKRGALVDRFQAGEAEVFLISLKAGGTGLNLTAASYVFHLDPWWNPAAEDQATDRAHRIGQDQPVTVYRLIARGTVEEPIVALHARKREVAAQVLAGSGSARAMSPEELEALILGEGSSPSGAPQAAVSPPDASFSTLVTRWLAHTQTEVEAGRLKAATAASYGRVAKDIAQWVSTHRPEATAEEAERAFPQLMEDFASGEWTGGSTVRHQGRIVLRHLKRFAVG